MVSLKRCFLFNFTYLVIKLSRKSFYAFSCYFLAKIELIEDIQIQQSVLRHLKKKVLH